MAAFNGHRLGDYTGGIVAATNYNRTVGDFVLLEDQTGGYYIDSKLTFRSPDGDNVRIPITLSFHIVTFISPIGSRVVCSREPGDELGLWTKYILQLLINDNIRLFISDVDLMEGELVHGHIEMEVPMYAYEYAEGQNKDMSLTDEGVDMTDNTE